MNRNCFIFVLKNIITKIPTNCPTIIIRESNIYMLAYTTKSITLQNSMNTHNFLITFIERTWQLIIHKSTIYGLMPQHNNVILDQHKLIEHIITLYILYLNYLTLFLNLLYHPLMNKLWTKKNSIQMKLQKLLRSNFVLFTMLWYEKHANFKDSNIYIRFFKKNYDF